MLWTVSEFAEPTASLVANPDDTTIIIDDPGDTLKHQPGLARGPRREEDEELLGNEDSDKTEV